MRAAVGIDDAGTLRVDCGDYLKPEPWARQLTDWLALLLATDLELFQLRTSALATDQFAVAAVKERSSGTTTIHVGTGRGEDAVNAVTNALTAAVCERADVLERAIERLTDDGAISAAAISRDGERGAHEDERMCRLLDAFDEPGLLEVRTDQGEYGALRLGEGGVALAVATTEPSPRVRRWLGAVWEGLGDTSPDTDTNAMELR